jgi:hypothetical protein
MICGTDPQFQQSTEGQTVATNRISATEDQDYGLYIDGAWTAPAANRLIDV